ncbi:MAG: hypothetical protein RB191_10980 [Terriglobia bacterium]|nr:hypothetical protein [Terriglobia bacterium]
MARIRTVKPELAAHEGMFDLERDTGLPIRFAWVMLFTVADREGRFQWRPRTLKAQILPHDEIDFSRVLDAWVTRAFVIKYRVGDAWYGCIPTFLKHQVINNRESGSTLPPISEADEVIQSLPRVDDACDTREVRALVEGKEGREGERKEGKDCTASAKRASPVVSRATPPDWYLNFKLVYPHRAGDPNWSGGLRAANARISEGHTVDEFMAGAERYAKFCESTGKVGTEIVQQASRFLGPGKPFLLPWDLPQNKAEARLATNINEMDKFLSEGAAP